VLAVVETLCAVSASVGIAWSYGTITCLLNLLVLRMTD